MSATSVESATSVRESGRRFEELEGLRALAAFAVLLTHAGFLSGATGRHVFPGFLARMDIGVPIFFVLSGFLLYRPHARRLAGSTELMSTKTYFIRRFARLIPAWALTLLGTLLLVPSSRQASATAWLANVLQLQSLKTEWDLPGLAQLWSLSTEVAFYLALPVVAWLIARQTRGPRARWLGLAGLVTATWAFRILVTMGALPPGFAWLRTLPGTGDWFAVGMALALLVAEPELRTRATAVVSTIPWHLYGLAACVFWVLTTRSAGPYDLTTPTAFEASVKHLGYTVVGALVVAPSVLGAQTIVSKLLASAVLQYFGRISYGIFLWHLPVMFAVRESLGLQTFAKGFWSTVILTLAISSVIAALSWRFVEAPIQRWAHCGARPPLTPRQSDSHEKQGEDARDKAPVRRQV